MVAEIIIDNSLSMGPYIDEKNNSYLLPGGITRMHLAKKILSEEILPLLEEATNITIRLFHSVQKEKGTTSTPVISKIFSGPFESSIIISKINGIKDPDKTGGTPITAALNSAFDDLQKIQEVDKKIFLVTDGHETDGGDYKKVIADHKSKGANVNLFLIGIAQSEVEAKSSKILAESTGGISVNLNSANYSKDEVKNVIRPIIFQSRQQTIQVAVAQSTTPKQEVKNPQANFSEENSEKISQSNVDNSIRAEINSTLDKQNKAITLLSEQMKLIFDSIQAKPNVEIDGTEIPEINERVRIASEPLVFKHLKKIYGDSVLWLNEKGESFSNYDFQILDTIDNSIAVYIDCKGTKNNDPNFFLSSNEWHFFLSVKEKYQIYLVTEALSTPKIFRIKNLLESIVSGEVVPYFEADVSLKKRSVLLRLVSKKGEVQL